MLDSPVSEAPYCSKSGESDRVLDDLRLIDTPLPSRKARAAGKAAGAECGHGMVLHCGSMPVHMSNQIHVAAMSFAACSRVCEEERMRCECQSSLVESLDRLSRMLYGMARCIAC